MVALPVLLELNVQDYGLYPGTEKLPGLHSELQPGLTLVLGANGLGKTTLVTLFYRMLAGTSDIPNLSGGGDFGNRRMEATPISRLEARFFATRVADGAEKATARLRFRLGESTYDVERTLDDLRLVRFHVDQSAQGDDESAYKSSICDAAGVHSFGDWVLLLRHLTFYFEDRRALVWDASAQRQILRVLFLSRPDSERWVEDSRKVLALDSAVRNLQFAVGREERALGRTVKKAGSENEVRQQLRLLSEVQKTEQQQLDALEGELVELDRNRQVGRLAALTAEQGYESAMRDVERLQMAAIATAFPSASETAQYIIGQLLADDECIACGTDVPEFAATLRGRLAAGECVVCGSPTAGGATGPGRLLQQASKRLQAAQIRRDLTASEKARAEEDFGTLLKNVSRLNASTARRSAEMDELLRRLPPDDQLVHDQRAGVSAMRARLDLQRAELDEARTDFSVFLARVNRQIAESKEAVKEAFDRLAHDFLFEDCSLVWAPRKDRLGETGGLIEFPAFELEMTSAAFESPVRRSGPSQVSESQREFVDLAFRMALMTVVTGRSGGTLIIDAPESSLDAVFVRRAADVLIRFGDRDTQNRLIITSNLIDGDLIPHLISKSGITSNRDRRVVDLLRLAAPTAAIHSLAKEYSDIRQRLFTRAKEL